MKVDMSPKAVKERLKTVDELWLLSVKLMNSKKIQMENKDDKQFGKNLKQKYLVKSSNAMENIYNLS